MQQAEWTAINKPLDIDTISRNVFLWSFISSTIHIWEFSAPFQGNIANKGEKYLILIRIAPPYPTSFLTTPRFVMNESMSSDPRYLLSKMKDLRTKMQVVLTSPQFKGDQISTEEIVHELFDQVNCSVVNCSIRWIVQLGELFGGHLFNTGW